MKITDLLQLDTSKDEPRELLGLVELDLSDLEQRVQATRDDRETIRLALTIAHLAWLREELRASV